MNSTMNERFESVSKISLKILAGVSWRCGGGAFRCGIREWVPSAEIITVANSRPDAIRP